jgi:hypothetical protein
MVSKALFISRAGQQHGPITEDEFREIVQLGHLKKDDLVRAEGAADWVPAESFIEFGTQGAQVSPPDTNLKTPTPTRWIGGFCLGVCLIVVVVGISSAIIYEPRSIPYRLAGAINGAIFGGIAGGLAALLQYLIKKRLTAAPVSIAVVLGFIVGQAVESSINFVGGEFYDRTVRPAVTQDLLGQKLDEEPIYQALKRADAEAYSRLRAEVAKRVTNGARSRDIETYTESYTAAFRRTHAEAAITASPNAIAALMRTLTDVFDYLHGRDDRLCGEYALRAFASERIRALAREAVFSTLLQRQAVTVFDAIAEGLRYPRAYEPLAEADIQLAVQGIERRGWSDQMRAALAEPNQLNQLPLDLVCRIQREWLATLGSLPEPARTRWYREVLGALLRG